MNKFSFIKKWIQLLQVEDMDTGVLSTVSMTGNSVGINTVKEGEKLGDG